MTKERALDRYGLSAAAESAWRALLADPGVTASSLAALAGLTTTELKPVLESLCDVQLMRADDAATSGYFANDPGPALEVLALRRERELARQSEDLATFRSQIPALADLFAEGRARAGVLPGFEIITSVDEIRRQIYLESERSTEQLRTLVHSGTHESYVDARDADLRAIGRGVRLRSIVRPVDLQTPGAYESSLWLSEHGEEVRALATVPTQMQILDSRLAVVRVDPDDSSKGAMFIRVSNLINLLIDLYERLWDEAEPLFPTSSSAPQLSERQHRLVALLASGAKDEAIARALSVGLRTIRRDISDLKMMAGARSRTDLVTAAIRKGWIASPSPPRESTSGIQTLADQRP